MADPLRSAPPERDIEQAITALKKGAYLLKYGRRGKPKFCPFRLSNDESVLLWYAGKDEKKLKLSQVSKIIPGQRTVIFQRYPRPDKEYQSFSLIYKDRSLDLICKDKDEAEVWFVGLKALISRGNSNKWSLESKSDRKSSDSPRSHTWRNSPLTSPFCSTDILHKDSRETQLNTSFESHPVKALEKVFSDVILYTESAKNSLHSDSVSNSLSAYSSANLNERGSVVDNIRVSLSSAVSSSSHGSGHEDFDALGDVFIWGEGIGDGVIGGALQRVVNSSTAKVDAPLPKALKSAVVLDVQNIACGNRHAVLVTKQGEVFSWGEELGGRLGHGVDADVTHPKLIDALCGMNVELVACGEYHTCAVTLSGDLHTWGGGTNCSGLLGHGSDASHWIPKRVCGLIDGLHVSSVSCGPWHTAIVTSAGQLFTFGDGTFGALGHGELTSANMPREVEALRGMRTVHVACGVWHTAAVVELAHTSSDSGGSSSSKLFTWGDGDKGRLGHGDRETRLVPACVASLAEPNFRQVACGNDITIALTTSGRIYTMGSTAYGQLGNPEADGKLPTIVEGNICDSFVEHISCGSYHVAVLTSRSEVYTWGKGANGRLGHGDNDDRNTPTLVEALKDKQVKSVVCGSNFTAAICLHKWVSGADQSICSGCHLPFGFRRKRHNCYNCGLVFCKACSSTKSTRASLAPNVDKPYRVCDECYTKLKKATGDSMVSRVSKYQHSSQVPSELADKVNAVPRLQGQGSRISSVQSFKYESRHSKEMNNSRLAPVLHQFRKLQQSNSSKSLNESSKKIHFSSVPSSRVASCSTSPDSCRQSPPYSMAPTVTDHRSLEISADDLKHMEENLSDEVVRLRLQVNELTHRSQHLKEELEKTSQQLEEAKAIAAKETAKCNAATEVLASLTSQLKNISGRVPEGYLIVNNYGSGYTSDLLSFLTSENVTSNFLASEGLESNGDSNNMFPCNGNMTLSDEVEWIEQAEPGVYITVSSLPGGDKYLKRVRFSRKRFSEHEAEKWWAENKSRLQERYAILRCENSSSALQNLARRAS